MRSYWGMAGFITGAAMLIAGFLGLHIDNTGFISERKTTFISLYRDGVASHRCRCWSPNWPKMWTPWIMFFTACKTPDRDWATVSVGDTHIVALKSDGTL